MESNKILGLMTIGIFLNLLVSVFLVYTIVTTQTVVSLESSETIKSKLDVPPDEVAVIFTFTYARLKEGKMFAADLNEKPIKDDVLYLKPGETKKLTYIFENPTDKPIVFFGAPHTFDPAESAAEILFKCFCMGEKFTAPPNGKWVREIEITLSEKVRAGQAVIINHQVVGAGM